MKHIIEFDLPDDQGELDITLKAPDMFLCLTEFRDWMRGHLKYGDGFTDDEAWEAFWKVCGENGMADNL